MIRAIFLDVDGTLVSFDTHRVHRSAIDALRQVHNSGCKIIIARGRAACDLHEIEEVPFDAVIALNGSDCVLRAPRGHPGQQGNQSPRAGSNWYFPMPPS